MNGPALKAKIKYIDIRANNTVPQKLSRYFNPIRSEVIKTTNENYCINLHYITCIHGHFARHIRCINSILLFA